MPVRSVIGEMGFTGRTKPKKRAFLKDGGARPMARKGWRERVVGLGTLAWWILATAPLPAQAPAEQGPGATLLDRPQAEMPGPWLPSPQYMSPTCAQAVSGLPYTSCVEGLTLKQMV